MNIAICCCYGSSLRPAFSHIILHECVHAVRVRLKLRLHISADWTRWFLNTIVVCSRYYFNSHSSFKVQFLPFVFSACHFISYALILRLSLSLSICIPERNVLKLLIFVYAVLRCFCNEHKITNIQNDRSISACVYIYTSLIEVKFLEIECCFVFSVGRKKIENTKKQALKNIRRRARIASHQEKPIHMCL